MKTWQLLFVCPAALFTIGTSINGGRLNAQTLPAPMTIINDSGVIPTLDASGNHVGRAWDFELTMSREFKPNNTTITPFTLTYWFGNGNGGETQGGKQTFSIDLLDSTGKTVVSNVLGDRLIKRDKCWYSGGAKQTISGTIDFDYAGKDIKTMKINVGTLSGIQTPC